MFIACFLLMKVIHRVGGLEVELPAAVATSSVIHRVGGLEVNIWFRDSDKTVIHRVGGLEVSRVARYPAL